MPRTTATGVFSSWLATSMNAFLIWFASVSRALDSFSSATRPPPLDDQVVLLDRLADDGHHLVRVPGLGDVAEDVALVDRVDDGADVGVAGEQQPGGVGPELAWRGGGTRRRSSPASAGRT